MPLHESPNYQLDMFLRWKDTKQFRFFGMVNKKVITSKFTLNEFILGLIIQEQFVQVPFCWPPIRKIAVKLT